MLRRDWLERGREDVLDPELPICDTHHHLWQGGPEQRERYLLDEMMVDISEGHNIVSSIFVECHTMYRANGPDEMRPVGEVEFANGMAAMSASGLHGKRRIAAGIVGAADLRLGRRVAEVLDAQMRASGRFRGIRFTTCWDARAEELMLWKSAPPRLLADANVRAGLACLQERNLIFDAWMLFPQLPELVELARAMPGLSIVHGHLGGLVGVGPYADHAGTFSLWKRNISALAACPNVKMKLGGIGMPRLGKDYARRAAPPTSAELAEYFEPYIMHCVEQFGPSRCMFESNYPADGRSAPYNTIWNAFKCITRGFSATEKAALFRDTGTQTYRI